MLEEGASLSGLTSSLHKATLDLIRKQVFYCEYHPLNYLVSSFAIVLIEHLESKRSLINLLLKKKDKSLAELITSPPQ